MTSLSTNPPVASVAISTYNGAKHIAKALHSVAKQKLFGYALRIVVVDNGSTDDTAGVVKAWQMEHPKSSCIFDRQAVNLGSAGGYNRAIALCDSQSRYVIRMDNDAWLEPDALQQLLSTADSDPTIGAVGGKILCANEPGRIHVIGFRRVRGFAGVFKLHESVGDMQLDSSEFDRSLDLDSVDGVLTLYRADLLRDIGTHDERFFLYHEDTDLMWRVRAAGYRVVYIPYARGFHVGSVSGGSLHKPRLGYYSVRNGLLFSRKHRSRAIHLAYSLLFAVRLAGRAFLVAAATLVKLARGVAKPWSSLQFYEAQLSGFRDFARGHTGEGPYR